MTLDQILENLRRAVEDADWFLLCTRAKALSEAARRPQS
jgi:hypothetical protein